jgi:phage terminase large subunit-like protein
MMTTNLPILSELRERYPESFLLEYIGKCKTGEILVGRELMQMLDILLGHFADPNIRIDFTEAHKRIKFIETQCKHFEAPFAGEPFILMLWQKAFIESIYAFYIYDEEEGAWLRKYQEVLLMVSRKNGKTPLVSALCLAEFFCGETGTKILCSSNDYAQADLAFQAINNMREQSPALEKATRKNIKGIYFGNPKKPRRKGKFSYANKGNVTKISARTKAQEGKNIRVGMADEVHEMVDDAAIMPMRQALSTQKNPLFIEITTEGFINEGYLDTRLKEARQVLNGELDRPRWLVFLYTQDSITEIWQDESTWVKSNPTLGTVKKWSFLRQMVDEARTNTGTRAFVLAKDFNIKQATAQAWLLPEEIDNPATFDIADLRGAIGMGGGDLSETIDLTSTTALIMRPGSKIKYLISHYFIPEAKIEQNEDKKDYLDWAKRGLLTICPGNEIDYSMVVAWYVNLYRQHGIRLYKICLDRWGASYLQKDLEDYGFDIERVTFEKHNVSNPMKTMEADLRSKLLNYNNHEITRWCLLNTGIKVDSTGLIMPVKMQPNKRIDGTAAAIMAYYGYNKYRTEYLQALR